ncbi:MAG: amidohydrolase [Proteobacteria bacterium]|nr:amidohydrolase [Pseudomonadota bacterium]
MKMKFFVLVFAIHCVSACSTSQQPVVENSIADTIYFNARIYTLDSTNPFAEAVAIKDGDIQYVGSDNIALSLAGAGTEKVDLNGQVLLPGFIDSHAHPVAGGAFALALSLDTYASPVDWVEAIADYASTNPDLPVIFGYGFLASAFGTDGPTRQMLDEVVPDRPVIIMDEGFHGAWTNSLLLKQLGINRQTKDLVPGFSYYKRDTQGNPSGYLLEETAGKAMADLNLINEESVTRGTALIIKTMNSYGITAVFDAGALDVATMQQPVLNALQASGDFTLRYVGAHMVADPGLMQEAIDTVVRLRNNSKTEHSHIRVLKIMDDGTVEGKTAAMFTDYQGEPGNKGQTVFNQQQLNWLVSAATSKAMDVHIHALGERAIHESLNAIETARLAYPQSDSRFAICHIQVITDVDLPRFAKLGVIAQSTPLWASYDEEGEHFVSSDQFRRYFRFNSLKQSGAKLSFGSDFPASGAGMLGMSPLYNIQIGHTRQHPGEDNAPVQPRTSERLDIASLIRGYTLDAAYQMHMEDQIGSIEIGKKADLVVLDKKLFIVDPAEISKINVVLTILDGEVVYRQP